ncbi:MAG: hypothetical protein ACLFU6_05510 [Candidatus Hydrogenedentota bacterium]
MRLEEFLNRHGLQSDPFATAEEAQGDEVLLRLCKHSPSPYGHPEWSKFCGSPPGNQSSIVFGFKGSGKTAMRLALAEAIARHNETNPDDRTLLVPYEEFNAYLENWRLAMERIPPRRRGGLSPDSGGAYRQYWGLAHHLDAIVAQAVRELVEEVCNGGELINWPEYVRYDLLFLAAVFLTEHTLDYRRTITELYTRLWGGWGRRSEKMRNGALAVGTLGLRPAMRSVQARAIARGLGKTVQVIDHDRANLVWALKRIPARYLATQPLVLRSVDPSSENARFETLDKVLRIARTMNYARVAVVIDKVDEPTLINGDYTRMGDFIVPLWNNKVLQTSGINLKMLLPAQLYDRVRKADAQLLNTARLDKANIIYPLTWSGEHLYEMLAERASACRVENPGEPFDLQQLFAPEVSRETVVNELAKLKLPRHAGKFMHRCLCEGCTSIMPGSVGPQELPVIPEHVFHKISERFEAELQNYTRDLQEY